MSIDTANFQRILVMRFHLIGDVLLVTPLIQNLRRQFPDSYIEMLTDAPSAELLRDHPLLNRLTIYNSEFGPQKFTLRDMTRHYAVLRHIRRQKFDLVINLQPGMRSEFATWYSGASCRVGYNRDRLKQRFYTVIVKDDWSPRYRADHMLDTLRAIGIYAKVELPSIGLTDADRDSVRPYVVPHTQPLIVIHSGRASTNKAWPEDRFAELCDGLVSKYGAALLLIGDNDEMQRVDRIIKATHVPCTSLAGRLNLKQVGAILEHARLFIGIDSSPLHVASAVGTPTVALFGPSDPRIWNPPGSQHIAIRKLPANHLGDAHHCDAGKSTCMNNIFPDDVLTAAGQLLNGHPDHQSKPNNHGSVRRIERDYAR